MQYWIFYQAGVGGDGFGCMLEHATNIKPADGFLEWRIHCLLQRTRKFYQAAWAPEPRPFRYNKLSDNILLNPVYIDLVEQQQNTVITAHCVYFDLITKFEHRNIVEKDQVTIHLYSNNSTRVYKDLQAKSGTNTPLEKFIKWHQHRNKIEFSRPEYKIHIDIEQIWRDWAYTKSCMEQLNIDLPRSGYDHYLTYIDNL